MKQPPQGFADLCLGRVDGCLEIGGVTRFSCREQQPPLKVWPGWIVRLGQPNFSTASRHVRGLLAGQREQRRRRSDHAVVARQEVGRVQAKQPGQQT